jgi:hypothetical protein
VPNRRQSTRRLSLEGKPGLIAARVGPGRLDRGYRTGDERLRLRRAIHDTQHALFAGAGVIEHNLEPRPVGRRSSAEEIAVSSVRHRDILPIVVTRPLRAHDRDRGITGNQEVMNRPGTGVVVQDAGKVVYDEDGNLAFFAGGRNHSEELLGDEVLCDALV